MGNTLTIHPYRIQKYGIQKLTPTCSCFICWEKIESIDKVTCIRCNISLHASCEETYRNINTRQYCKCPHCQQIGTLCI